MEKEKNEQNSQEQAEILKMISVPILMLDVEYCREMAKDLKQQVNMQQISAALNPNLYLTILPTYSEAKNKLILLQAKALDSICDYVDSLREIDKTKLQIVVEEKQKDQINQLFL